MTRINDNLAWALSSLSGALANIGECQRLLAAEAAKPQMITLKLHTNTLRLLADLADRARSTIDWRRDQPYVEFIRAAGNLALTLEARHGQA